MKLKHPKRPANISMHEMTVILGARKQGMTHKEIKLHIDQDRKYSGTYKGKGISTNTISRLLGKTHSKKMQAKTKEVWATHAKKEMYATHLEKVASRIEDSEKRAKFMRFARQQTERSRGRQYELEVGYEAETDEYYVTSP